MKLSIKRNYWQQDIKKKEYILAFGKGALLVIAVSRLFYHSLLVGIILLPLSLIYVKSWERQRIKTAKQAFRQQFKDALQTLASALAVGYSVENATRSTLKELELIYDSRLRIVREFRYMCSQLKMNLPVEQVWEEFSQRVQQEDVQNFVTVFTVAKKSGGDTIAILQDAVGQISDKVEVKREIETLLAQKQLEFRIMSLVPMGIIAYMSLSFPEFMGALYGNPAGVLIMTVCLIGYALAWRMGKKMIEIEV